MDAFACALLGRSKSPLAQSEAEAKTPGNYAVPSSESSVLSCSRAPRQTIGA